MNVTIITDCLDENAKGRLVARTSSLFNSPVSFIGVKSEIEVAGNLIDILDAYENHPGVILVNVAPRNGKGKNFSNGTPFGYFWYEAPPRSGKRNPFVASAEKGKKVLVVTTIDGYVLSLVKKLKLVESVSIIDLEKSLEKLLQARLIIKDDFKSIKNTQFRSFNFQPKAAKYLYLKRNLPSRPHLLSTIPNTPNCIWWIDNFGNCKLTLLYKDLKSSTSEESDVSLRFTLPASEVIKKENTFEAAKVSSPASVKVKHSETFDSPGVEIKTNLGTFSFYKRLKDVPNRKKAIVVGSSGLGNNRFLEIVIQGKSAAQSLKLKVGDTIQLL